MSVTVSHPSHSSHQGIALAICSLPPHPSCSYLSHITASHPSFISSLSCSHLFHPSHPFTHRLIPFISPTHSPAILSHPCHAIPIRATHPLPLHPGHPAHPMQSVHAIQAKHAIRAPTHPHAVLAASMSSMPANSIPATPSLAISTRAISIHAISSHL